ncbi:MAG: hypothetical protein FWF90_17430 [Promicromonosporaceae bacterium]|nr:hypothetical protein [Promicromonosporaceae bacterium]
MPRSAARSEQTTTTSTSDPSGAWTYPEETSPSLSPSDLPSPPLSDETTTSTASSWDGVDPVDVSDQAPAFDDPTSSRASSGKAGFTKKHTQEGARNAVKMVGVGAHQFLARDEFEQAVGLYLTDETDDKAIGDPVGSIVHRHGWLGQAANPDVVDGVNALIGVGVYVWKQVQRAWAARAARAAAAATAQAAESAAAADGSEAGGSPW